MKTFGIVAGLTAAGIWGGMYVVSKVVLDVIPPFALLSLRLVLGAGCLALVLYWRGGPKINRRTVLQIGAVGLLGYGVSVGLQFVGTKLSTAANASLVTTASPAFMILFGALILRERATWQRLTALVLASLGVLAVIDFRGASLGGPAFWGDVALLGASITWALYSVLVRVISRKASTLEVSLIAFVGGLPLSVPAGTIEVAGQGIGEINVPVILGVLYLGLVSTALAMYLWNKSLAILEAGMVSLLFFAQPIVGAGLGATMLQEPLTAGFWVGAVLIGAGLLIGSRSQAVPPSVRLETTEGVAASPVSEEG